jgi:sugar O-acyltransferase (sialic acid O-acetyltransferase NeuD family)
VRPAFIFGKGGHARVIASLLDREVTFIDKFDESSFFDRIDEARKSDVFLGIGNDETRQRIYSRLNRVGIVPRTCIAKNAFVASSAFVGPGTVICPGAVVMTNAVVGENVIINTLSSVDHDCAVGDHCQMSVAVSLCGQVSIGTRCFLGVKSAVFPEVKIGDHVIVRGGSLVIKDVPSQVVIGGNPAMIIRTLSVVSDPPLDFRDMSDEGQK